MSKRTLHVITEYHPHSRLETYWNECFYDPDFNEYRINIIDGTLVRRESLLWSDTYYKTTQLKSIMDLIHSNEVRNGDIFIFVNAWNFSAVPISYFRDEYGLDIKMIGIWGNSVFNPMSPLYQRFKRKNKSWARDFELSLFNSYDFNCFFCQEHLNLFFNKYPLAKRKGKHYITGYPFEYISKSLLLDNKEDIIIFPYQIVADLQVDVFRGLESELTQYKFVKAQEGYNTRLSYTKFLRKCKLMFCAKNYEYNPVLLWEGMMNAVIPIIPEVGIFDIVFPKKYLYPKALSIPKNNKFLYVIRNRIQMEDFIKDRFNQYDSLKEEVLSDGYQIMNKYYLNKPFLDLLNKC